MKNKRYIAVSIDDDRPTTGGMYSVAINLEDGFFQCEYLYGRFISDEHEAGDIKYWLKEQEPLIIPDFYAGELNTKRINKISNLKDLYDFYEITIGKIFCEGIDFATEKIKEHNLK